MGNDYDYYPGPYYYPPGVIGSSIRQVPQAPHPISIKLKKFDFYKGEYVEGAVVINNTSPMIISEIYLNLYLVEQWNSQDGTTQMAEFINPKLVSVKVGVAKILKIDSNLINLNVGLFNFPFKFKLPDNIQPSFEYPKFGVRGFLRYILEAKLSSQYVQGEGKTYLFIKSRPLTLNCPLLFSSAANVHKWGMIDQGSTILKVSYKTSDYQMRSQIPITVEIDNTRGKLNVKSVNVKAVRRVQYKKVNIAGVQLHLEDIMVNKVFAVNVPANSTSQTYTYAIDLKEEMLSNFNYAGVSNPYPRLKDLTFAMPTTNGSAIKCDYFLVITLSFTSFVTDSYIPKVIIPFALTHQLQDDYNLEKKEDDDLKKAIEASLLDLKNANTINEININDENQNKEEILDDKKEENIQINKEKKKVENINQISEHNNIQEDNNKIINDDNNINNINNINYDINENNNNINNDVHEKNIYEDDFDNNLNIESNNQNKNNKIINSINNNNQINNEINEQNNNYIKFEENEDINPYQIDSENNENNNNKRPKNFSINDDDEVSNA
jgi:hypothetical protein